MTVTNDVVTCVERKLAYYQKIGKVVRSSLSLPSCDMALENSPVQSHKCVG